MISGKGYSDYLYNNRKKKTDDAVRFWADYFDTQDENVLYYILSRHPELVTMYTDEFGKAKMAGRKVFENFFNLQPAQVGPFLREHSILATINTDPNKKTSFQHKVFILQQQYDYTAKEIADILKKNPAYICLNHTKQTHNNSVNAKQLKIRKYITDEEILANPRLMNVPAQKFVTRYMISVISNCRKQFINGGFMMNEAAAYARMEYLLSNGYLPLTNASKNKSILYMTEKDFSTKFGVSTAALKAKYPIDSTTVDAVAKSLEQRYTAATKRAISLTQQEKDSIIK